MFFFCQKKAKALAEEGLFDLIGDAWGEEATERAYAYVEEEAVPYLPLDVRAFELAVQGKLEPGGELETNYGKAAVEVRETFAVFLDGWRGGGERGFSRLCRHVRVSWMVGGAGGGGGVLYRLRIFYL